jgi:hypothetical protein
MLCAETTRLVFFFNIIKQNEIIWQEQKEGLASTTDREAQLSQICIP